jgi:D-alanyl-D-alanine carboxypeptidase (penicillin-binding protein 5/6)
MLCRHLLTKTDVLKYTSIRSRDFAPERAKGPMKMENHNKLLGKVAGVDGLKTGFTNSAGYCLSATAERNGRRLILVIMGSLGPGGQHDLGKTRDLKAVELIERGFTAMPIGGAAFKSDLPPSPVAAAPTPPGAGKDKPANQPLDASQPLKLTLPKK